MNRLRQLISAILAGMGIGMGGIIFLTQSNPVVGSFLFSVGLFTVLVFQLQLYTGKIGYLVFEKPSYFIELGITWVGNFMGAFLAAWMITQTRVYGLIIQKAESIVAIKLNDTLSSIFILSIFCGLLMYIAVGTYKSNAPDSLKFPAVFLPVMVFILSSFEHVIANMFYFSLVGVWNGKIMTYLLVMTLGNSIGGLLIPTYLKLFKVG